MRVDSPGSRMKPDSPERAHGGDRSKMAEILAVDEDSLLDFSSNINPLGPPAGVIKAVAEAATRIDRYPDQWAERFIRAAAEHHSVPVGCVLAANGSIELIHLLSVAFEPKTVALVAPDFCEYEISFGKRSELRFVELERGDGFDLDFAAAPLREADVVVLSNPNNPTGLLLDPERLRHLALRRGRDGKITVVDEAFIDFAPDASLIGKVETGLIILRSVTKFYSLAGLRLGYLIADQEHIGKLKTHHWPWSVNALAIAAGIAALEDSLFRRRSLEVMSELRKALFDSLSALSWLKPHPSAANYLLVELMGDLRSTDLTWALAKGGILVRDCSSFRGLGDRFIRVAVRTAEENSRLLEAIESAEPFGYKV